MILPTITATIREVFLQTPRLHEEASLALGATRWEMVQQAVLPFARSGIISASMLGLGRALRETMAVLMILLTRFRHQPVPPAAGPAPDHRREQCGTQFPEAAGLGVDILIATGLILFIITFLVNMAARAVIARRAEFSGAN